MNKMTSFERMDAVLRGEQPDRVPVADYCAISVVKTMGYQMKDIRFDAEKSVKAALDFNKIVGSDIITSPIIETASFYMDLGVQVSMPDDNYSMVTGAYFATPEDVDSKELYDPLDPNASKNLRRGITDKIALLYEKKPADIFTTGWTWGPFSGAGFLRGVETLLMDVLTEPDLAMKSIKKATALIEDVIKLELDSGNNGMFVADPTASSTVISPETYDEVVGESAKRIFAKIKTYDVPAMMHICGDTTPMLPLLPGLGLDCFSIDHGVDVGVAKKAVGDKVTIMGNVHPIEALWYGTPASVMDASKICIEKAAQNGRFVLAPGCEVPKDAPNENVIAMVNAAKKYGVY